MVTRVKENLKSIFAKDNIIPRVCLFALKYAGIEYIELILFLLVKNEDPRCIFKNEYPITFPFREI